MSRHSLLPRKTQMGFKKRIPAIVKTIERIKRTMEINVKISLASHSLFCPSFADLIYLISAFKNKAYIYKSETNPYSQFELPLEMHIELLESREGESQQFWL